jgi:hypothetical protein
VGSVVASAARAVLRVAPAPALRVLIGVAVVLLTAVALAGCGSHPPRAAGLRLERTDLARLGYALRRLELPVHAEVSAARAVWPALAGGLPHRSSPATHRAITRALARADAIQLPTFVTAEGGLTGPAAGVGGLLKSYTVLTGRGWQFLAAASGEGRASFLRANSGLYVYCVYDGHFELSVLGKKLQSAYRKLGGGAAFGAALTPADVEALARAYSGSATRLEPHPAPHVRV